MQTHDVTAPLSEIKKALGDKLASINEADLEDELKKYLDYGVPADQAVKTILRHHGALGAATAPAATNSEERTPLAQVPGDVPYVNLLARVLSHNVKSVNARGEEKQIVWGMLGDETASRSFTSWRPLEGIEKGDVLEIKGAYTKEWRGEVQIQFGDRCQIEKKADEDLPKTPTETRAVKIRDLVPGDRGLEITGRILDVGSKKIQVQGEPKTIWEGTIADESGRVSFTSWSDPGLEANAAVTISGGYVRAFRGIPQFNFDSEATVSPATSQLPEAKALTSVTSARVSDVLGRAQNDVTVVATLVEVRPGSGLIWRDPDTRRVVTGTQIDKDKSVPDMRIKGVLDDGTGALNIIVNRQLTEDLLGKSMEECQKEAQEAFRGEIIQEQLQDKLTGRVFTVNGNVLHDDFGSMLIVRSIEPWNGDLEGPANDLLARLGGL